MSGMSPWSNPPSGRNNQTFSNATFTGAVTGTSATWTGDFVPTTTNAYDLGITGTRWRHLWLSGSATVVSNFEAGGNITTTGGGVITTANTNINSNGNLRLKAFGYVIPQSDGVWTFTNEATTGGGTIQLGTTGTSLSPVSAGVIGVGTGAAGSVAGAIQAGYYATNAPVTETGATHTVATTTAYLIANRAGDIVVTLPAAASFTGRQLTIKTIQAQTVTSNASNVVPQAGGAAGTAILAGVAGNWATLVSDGTSWVTMASNTP